MRLLPALSVLLLQPVFAADQAGIAEPLSYGKAANVIVSLMLVLAVLFACAWLMRRGRSVMGQGGHKIAVTSQLAVGVREKILLLRVGEENILVGFAGGTLRTLHSWQGDEPPDIDIPRRSTSFSETLTRLTGTRGDDA